MIELFLNLSSITLQLFHRISWFLSTSSGELIKSVIELLVYTFVSYMLISEFRKSRKTELKYLIVAFLSLMLGRLFITSALSSIVFTGITTPNVDVFLPIIDNSFEIIALILVANAFLYPIYKHKEYRFHTLIFLELICFLIISTVIQYHWLNVHIDNTFAFTIGYYIYELLKLIIFSYPILLIINNKKQIGKYAGSIAFAFTLYLFSPLINIINYLFFHSQNEMLQVIAHPFPLLSMLFFTRVVFLKLVDKAVLKEKLFQTQQKYLHEKELAKLKDEFVSTVSHELRTPLTNVKLYLGLLLNKEFGEINKQQKEKLNLIKDEGDRLTALINDVLSLSKLEAKKYKLYLRQINLYQLAESSVYYEMAKKKGIKVINKIPKSLIVKIDENMFRQVIINLFSNALKFTDKGRIVLDAEKTENGFSFSIEDTGTGIEKEKQEKIFERFYQADSSMTRKEGGTGLGLAIVKKIIDMHKGQIKLDSVIGKGTKFTIIIPDTIE